MPAVLRPPDETATGAARAERAGGPNARAVGRDDVLGAVRCHDDRRLAGSVGGRGVDVGRGGELTCGRARVRGQAYDGGADCAGQRDSERGKATHCSLGTNRPGAGCHGANAGAVAGVAAGYGSNWASAS